MIRRKCCNIQPYNDVEILRINLKIKSYYKLLNTVLFGKYSGTEVHIDDKKYLVMNQSDILAIL